MAQSPPAEDSGSPYPRSNNSPALPNSLSSSDGFWGKCEWWVWALGPPWRCLPIFWGRGSFSSACPLLLVAACVASFLPSWDVGPAHLISFSTEVYFFLDYGEQLVAKQFQWLERDLQVGWIRIWVGGASLRQANMSLWFVPLGDRRRTSLRGVGTAPGSSPWGIGPCTAPTLTRMTAPSTRAS